MNKRPQPPALADSLRSGLCATVPAGRCTCIEPLRGNYRRPVGTFASQEAAARMSGVVEAFKLPTDYIGALKMLLERSKALAAAEAATEEQAAQKQLKTAAFLEEAD